jgi:hypothetical protein
VQRKKSIESSTKFVISGMIFVSKIIFQHLQLVLAVGFFFSILVSEATNREDNFLHERGSLFVQLEKPSFSGHEIVVNYRIDTCIVTKTSSFSLSLNVVGGGIFEAAYGTLDCSGLPTFVGHHILLQPAPMEYSTVEHTSIFAENGTTVTVTSNPTTINHAASDEGILRSIFHDRDNCQTGLNAQEVSFSRHNLCAYDAFNGLYNQVVEIGCSYGTGERTYQQQLVEYILH